MANVRYRSSGFYPDGIGDHCFDEQELEGKTNRQNHLLLGTIVKQPDDVIWSPLAGILPRLCCPTQYEPDYNQGPITKPGSYLGAEVIFAFPARGSSSAPVPACRYGVAVSTCGGIEGRP